MNLRELKSLDKRIADLSMRIDYLVSLRDELLEISIADLNKYLCVLISGYAEKYFVYLIENYCEGKVPKEIKRYIEIDFRHTTNLSMKKIEDIFDKFSTVWLVDFQNSAEYQNYKDSIDYIINNRNKISHGDNTSLSKNDILFNYGIIKQMFEYMNRYFGCFVRI